MIARKDSSKYNSSYNISQKIVAVSSMNAEDIYFILTNNDKGRLIIFLNQITNVGIIEKVYTMSFIN